MSKCTSSLISLLNEKISHCSMLTLLSAASFWSSLECSGKFSSNSFAEAQEAAHLPCPARMLVSWILFFWTWSLDGRWDHAATPFSWPLKDRLYLLFAPPPTNLDFGAFEFDPSFHPKPCNFFLAPSGWNSRWRHEYFY